MSQEEPNGTEMQDPEMQDQEPQDQESQDQESQEPVPQDQEPQEGVSRGLVIGVIAAAAVVILLLVLVLSGAFSGDSEDEGPSGEANITILIPPPGSTVDITQPVRISGTGGGLFEGNVVVQALDEAGTVLVDGATTIASPEAGTGGEGPWTIDLTINAAPGTSGTIRAFSTSPEDGSVVAEDSVQVTYGEETVIEAFIKIGSPANGAVVDISAPFVVEGSGGGLYEGSVVVQVVDQQGNLLTEQATIVDAPDAGTGGEGPWRVELSVDVEPGTLGTISAYSPSPESDEPLASDSVEVSMGEPAAPAESYVAIEAPADGASLDTGSPVVVSGMGAGLFEGNVVVQALDGQGNVLAEQPTVLQSQEAGGEGPWQVELNIQVAPDTSGTIKAFSPSPVEGEGNMGEDSVSVVFTQASLPEDEVKLEDHLWLLQSYSGKQVLEGTMITAEFTDGQIAGKAGCNNYFASYEASSGSITIPEPVGSTMMFCQDPEGVMEQEGEYLGLLVQAASYQFSDGLMEIADASGNVILVYQAAVVGNVIAPEGSLIPEGATAEITVSDVSRQDVAATVIGRQVVENPAGFPFQYAVSYNAEDIDPRFTYAVGVRITDSSGNLIYINTSAYLVITSDNPSMVDVLVDPV